MTLALSRITQRRIFERDEYKCKRCHRELPAHWEHRHKRGSSDYLVVDHIIPKTIEINDEESNLQTLCAHCNNRKSARSTFTVQVMDMIQLLGRPVISYPFLTRIVGLNASVFISQLLYWTPRVNRHHNGWIYKTAVNIEEETGLSYKEQATAREKLIEAGLLEERYDRENHRMDFRIIPAGLKSTCNEHFPEEHMPFEHMPSEHKAATQGGEGTLPKGGSYKEIESTTEITAESAAAAAASTCTECGFDKSLCMGHRKPKVKSYRPRTHYQREDRHVEEKPKRSAGEERRERTAKALEVLRDPGRLPENVRRVLAQK